MGVLKEAADPHPWFADEVDEFTRWMTEEKGVAVLTARSHRSQTAQFLNWLSVQRGSLAAMRLRNVDDFLIFKEPNAYEATTAAKRVGPNREMTGAPGFRRLRGPILRDVGRSNPGGHHSIRAEEVMTHKCGSVHGSRIASAGSLGRKPRCGCRDPGIGRCPPCCRPDVVSPRPLRRDRSLPLDARVPPDVPSPIMRLPGRVSPNVSVED